MWIQQDTTTHQDHVIAHVVGSTMLGHFTFDESIYLLLDIGFIWQIYLDGDMGLLPWTVAIQELETSGEIKQQLRDDSEGLLSNKPSTRGLERMLPAPVDCLIKEVDFLINDDKRRLTLRGEDGDLILETSLLTREINLSIDPGS